MYYIYVYYLIKRKSNNNQFDKTKSKQQSIEIFFCIDIDAHILSAIESRCLLCFPSHVFIHKYQICVHDTFSLFRTDGKLFHP